MRKVEEIDKELLALQEELNNIKSPKIEIYQRITGYYRSLHNWGNGKVEEYKDRKAYALPASCGCDA